METANSNHRQAVLTIASCAFILVSLQCISPIYQKYHLEFQGDSTLKQFWHAANYFFSPPIASSPSFADVFPERHFVLDMMQLSFDIFRVDDEDISPSDAISKPDKFQFERFIKADFSTTAMIVSAPTNYNNYTLSTPTETENLHLANSNNDNDQTTKMIPIVIFRGSDNIQDYLVDVNIRLTPSKFPNAPPEVRCHKGFQDALFNQGVVSTVESKIIELTGGGEGNVIFTGHSLGAANAHITATYMADVYPKMNITVINFGAPRLGNRSFKSWTEGTLSNLAVWRFVNKRDIVPRAIPTRLGYAHAGHLHTLTKEAGRVYYRQIGDTSQNFKGAPRHWYSGTSAFQHPHPVYLKEIKSIMNNDNFWPTRFESLVPTIGSEWLEEIISKMLHFGKR